MKIFNLSLIQENWETLFRNILYQWFPTCKSIYKGVAKYFAGVAIIIFRKLMTFKSYFNILQEYHIPLQFKNKITNYYVAIKSY